MSNYLTTDTDLTSVANAIRTKGGTSAQLAFPTGFVDAIDAIETGGGGEPEIELLDTITITEPISRIVWDIPSKISKFAELWVFASITFSAADWLYVAVDTTTTVDSSYTPRTAAASITLEGHMIVSTAETVGGNTVNGLKASNDFAGENRLKANSNTQLSKLNIFPYYSSTTFTGGTIAIYGRGW